MNKKRERLDSERERLDSGWDWTVNRRDCVNLDTDSQQNRRLYHARRPIDAVEQAGEAAQQVVMIS